LDKTARYCYFHVFISLHYHLGV